MRITAMVLGRAPEILRIRSYWRPESEEVMDGGDVLHSTGQKIQ